MKKNMSEMFVVLDDTYLPEMAELYRKSFGELSSHVSF